MGDVVQIGLGAALGPLLPSSFVKSCYCLYGAAFFVDGGSIVILQVASYKVKQSADI